ncbi:MAG: PDZ domain-containing protein [Alphaproteobacteria bacterium]|nr:PDZ domain-containing protein [Alphaproteobacteria bacterium]
MQRFTLVLAAVLAGFALGSPASQRLGPTAAAAEQVAAAEAFAPVETYRNKILVIAEINGRPFTAVYDSGAARSALSAQAAEALGLTVAGRATASGFGGDAEVRFARDVEVTLAGRSQTFRRLPVIDYAPLTRSFGRQFDLILGVDLFPDAVTMFDPGARRLSFTPRESFTPPAGAHRLRLTRHRGNYELTMRVNGETARANFDLGAGDALALSHAFAQRIQLDASNRPARLATGIGGDHDLGLASVARAELAGHDFADVPVSLAPDRLPTRADVNLGYALLSRFRLFMDFRRETLWLEPLPGATEAGFERDLAGMTVRRLQPDRLTIAHVSPVGPAHDAGLVAGDEILAVDGAHVADWPQGADVRAWSFGPDAPRAAALTLADGRAVTVSLRRFY